MTELTMAPANNDEVICPSCCNQFRAIPVNVQTELNNLLEQRATLCAELGIGEATDTQSIIARVQLALATEKQAVCAMQTAQRVAGEATGALETAGREIALLKSRLSIEEVRLHEGSAQ